LQVVKIFIKNVLSYSKINQNMTNFYGTTSTDFKACFSPNWRGCQTSCSGQILQRSLLSVAAAAAATKFPVAHVPWISGKLVHCRNSCSCLIGRCCKNSTQPTHVLCCSKLVDQSMVMILLDPMIFFGGVNFVI
jgi:hypothetical protein